MAKKRRNWRSIWKYCATGRKTVAKEPRKSCLSISILNFSELVKCRKTYSGASRKLVRHAEDSTVLSRVFFPEKPHNVLLPCDAYAYTHTGRNETMRHSICKNFFKTGKPHTTVQIYTDVWIKLIEQLERSKEILSHAR